jgi:hypothetical protein
MMIVSEESLKTQNNVLRVLHGVSLDYWTEFKLTSYKNNFHGLISEHTFNQKSLEKWLLNHDVDRDTTPQEQARLNLGLAYDNWYNTHQKARYRKSDKTLRLSPIKNNAFLFPRFLRKILTQKHCIEIDLCQSQACIISALYPDDCVDLQSLLKEPSFSMWKSYQTHLMECGINVKLEEIKPLLKEVTYSFIYGKSLKALHFLLKGYGLEVILNHAFFQNIEKVRLKVFKQNTLVDMYGNQYTRDKDKPLAHFASMVQGIEFMIMASFFDKKTPVKPVGLLHDAVFYDLTDTKLSDVNMVLNHVEKRAKTILPNIHFKSEIT